MYIFWVWNLYKFIFILFNIKFSGLIVFLWYLKNNNINDWTHGIWTLGGNNASLKVMVKSLFMFCIFCFHYVDFFASSSRERLIKPRHQYDSIQNNIIKVQKLSYTSLYSISLKVGESFINLYSIFWKWGIFCPYYAQKMVVSYFLCIIGPLGKYITRCGWLSQPNGCIYNLIKFNLIFWKTFLKQHKLNFFQENIMK
jgi:hypothetical protein